MSLPGLANPSCRSVRFGWIGLLILSVSGCAKLQTSGNAEQALEQIVAPVAELPNAIVEAVEPSNDRDWSPDQALLAYGEFHGDSVTVHNIRDCVYRSEDDYTVNYHDKVFDLNKIRSLDFIVVPFLGAPSLAHLAMSFGFQGDDYVGVSVEIRREKGEAYNPVKGALRQYELMYVVADEEDFIRLRTDHHLSGVYVYRANLPPEKVRRLFVDVIQRANRLTVQPEFYDTLTNNCTTAIVHHLNRLEGIEIPPDYRTLLPGHFDRMLYDLGMLETDTSFAQTRLRARVNRLAYLYADSPDFSAKIRR
jgi:hypothetical protein